MRKQFNRTFALIVCLFIAAPTALAGKPLEKSGTFAAPKIAHVGVLGDNGLNVRRTVFSYRNAGEDVVGTTTNVHFTLDLPVKDVWPTFQNFNLWQTVGGVSFSGPFGDKVGEMEYLIYQVGGRENVTIDNAMVFVVEQIVPEHLIVIHSPLFERVDANGKRSGSRHEGKNTFMLTEVDGKTIVTAVMEHAYHYYGKNAKANAAAGLAKTIEKAKARKKDIWEGFVPKLKEVLAEKK